MKLQAIADGSKAVALALVGADAQLSREIQQALGRIGLLDPPADGVFGPVSHWALSQFLERLGLDASATVDAGIAQLLMTMQADDLFPLRWGDGLAGKVVRAMQSTGDWICRHPQARNIVYVEGMDPDGKPNGNAANAFNDLRLVFGISDEGVPALLGSWEATTEPGRHHTVIELLDPEGAARIAFGQWKAWSVGAHNRGKRSEHEGLVQSAPITVHRDLDKNFDRKGDRMFTGNFGVNQHWGFDLPYADIGRASAGCLVGRFKSGHRAFMALCKSDTRYLASQGYKFMTTVLPASQIPAL